MPTALGNWGRGDMVPPDEGIKFLERRMPQVAKDVINIHMATTNDSDKVAGLREFSNRLDNPFAGLDQLSLDARMHLQNVITSVSEEFFLVVGMHKAMLFSQVNALCYGALKGHIGAQLFNR